MSEEGFVQTVVANPLFSPVPVSQPPSWIEPTLWEALEPASRHELEELDSAIAPSGISREAWRLLPQASRERIRAAYVRIDKVSLASYSVEATTSSAEDAPDWIPRKIWQCLDVSGKQDVLLATSLIPPHGIDSSIWEQLNIKTRCLLTTAVKSMPPRRSNIITFFLNFDEAPSDENFAQTVNAMALVCALLLTIPFSIMGSLNSAYFSELQSALSDCGEAALSEQGGTSYYVDQYQNLVATLASILYSGLLGLVLTTVHYLFRPAQKYKMSSRDVIKKKVLLFCLTGATSVSIISLVSMASYIFSLYTIQFKDICTYDSRGLYAPGITLNALAFLVALKLVS